MPELRGTPTHLTILMPVAGSEVMTLRHPVAANPETQAKGLKMSMVQGLQVANHETMSKAPAAQSFLNAFF